MTGEIKKWLAWNTGYFDFKLSKGEVIITSNQCRESGSSCYRTSQCYKQKITRIEIQIATDTVTCNQDTHACEQAGRQEQGLVFYKKCLIVPALLFAIYFWHLLSF